MIKHASLGLIFASSLWIGSFSSLFSSSAGQNTSVLTASTFGLLLLARLMLGVFIFTLANSNKKRKWIIGLALSLVLVFLTSQTSHSSAVAENTWLSISSDLIHQLAGYFWLSGIVLLSLICGKIGDKELSKELGKKFAETSFLALVIVALTGFFLAIIHLKALENLWITQYGISLVVKTALFLVIVALGYFKRNKIENALERLIEFLSKPIKRFTQGNRELGQIALLFLLLFLSVSFLTSLSPPLAAASQSFFSEQKQAGKAVIGLTITPFQKGENKFLVNTTQENGTALDNVKSVFIIFSYKDKDLGDQIIPMDSTGNGSYAVKGNFLALAGNWIANVKVIRINAYDEEASFALTVRD